MKVSELVHRYPRLWHMADPRNTAGIFKRGLMSTSALLKLYRVGDAERNAIESRRRPEEVLLENRRMGLAVIRDQRPLSESRIESSLENCSVAGYLRFLNSHVFFWPTQRRLATMNAAQAYRDIDQLVLLIDTATLVKAHQRRIRLSPINSGATRPFAWPRSIEMFQTVPAFDFQSRRTKPDPIAEILVRNRVSDILNHVIQVEVWRGGQLRRSLRPPYSAQSVIRRLSRLR